MDERKRILKLVEEGKLSVDEALVLLENSGRKKPVSFEKMEQDDKERHFDFFGTEEEKERIISEKARGRDFFDFLPFSKEESQEQLTKFKETIKDAMNDEKIASTKTKLFDFLDGAIKKVKDMDLDFNFSLGKEVEHTFIIKDSFQMIDVDIANGDVKVIAWDESDAKLECKAKVFKSDSEEEAHEFFLAETACLVENELLRISAPKKNMRVHTVLYVPQKMYNTIRLRLFNGAVLGEKIQTKKVYAKTANGSIKFQQVTADEVDFETVNGSIHTTDSTIGELEAETINGSIQVDGSYHRVDLHSVNGNVTTRLRNTDGEAISVKTVAGSIQISVPEDANVSGELKANLGSVHMKHPHVKVISEKNETLQKWISFETANAEFSQPLIIQADTKTGSISLLKN